MGYKFAILKNELYNAGLKWGAACRNHGIESKMIELTKDSWYDELMMEPFDYYLVQPPGLTERYKRLFDERMYIISKVMNLKTYPTYEEIIIHENKRFLYEWLKANGLPHPETHIFYDRKDAMQFLGKIAYPIVSKTNIGSSGSGVHILKTKHQAKSLVNRLFSTKGLVRYWGPNFRSGNLINRLKKRIKNFEETKKILKKYADVRAEPQKGFAILQHYIPHEYEWRCARIGDSYFAHQKEKAGEKCSGSLGINYVDPPHALLDFVREICENHNFQCMSVDILEGPNGEYLINEMQTLFGHVQDYIMKVNDKIGRYTYQNPNWVFEAGNFNSNESYDLRLKNVLYIIER